MNSRLECRNLTKDYGNVMALSDVNLTLESGRIVGLLGPNGSGKTTMIKLANGLLQPTSGEILLNGLKPGPETKSFVCGLLCGFRPKESRRNDQTAKSAGKRPVKNIIKR